MNVRYLIRNSCLLALLTCLSCKPQPSKTTDTTVDYTPLIQSMKTAVERELVLKELPAVSIALVDDQKTVWSEGFGMADAEKKVPATAETIYRVGSVSKLFTDIGIMQLVEDGVIDLDLPVTNYLPDFQPSNPFGVNITLRQLMSHRSGLVREPPSGHYFDDTEPSLKHTVESLNQTTLVYPPETRIKYSNAGIAVVGYVLEHIKEQPFATYLKKAVLDPLGLQSSSFSSSTSAQSKHAKAQMWAYDGRQFNAPTFELGMSPAGSMYASVEDLARFMKMLFNHGKTGNHQLLNRETLETMWTPQYTKEGANTGYGIGFNVSELEGHKMVGHGGAIYGFATQLYLVPGQKCGVVITTSLDGANAVMDRLARYALRSMLALKEERPPPIYVKSEPVDPMEARKIDGKYADDDKDVVELKERNGRLFLWGGSRRTEIRETDEGLMTDGRLGFGQRIDRQENGDLLIENQRFRRLMDQKPEPCKEAWSDLIGEYGWDYNTLFIIEKNNRLHALIEWFFMYPLQEEEEDVYAFPDFGLYHGEKIHFERNNNGRVIAANAAGIVFNRRPMAEDGATFKIKPILPIEEIRDAALKAEPPKADETALMPDLVELIDLDPTIKLDIRYATTNNFMDKVFYGQPRAFLQRPAAEALVRVQQKLKQQGLGLMIHDAYRPWYVTKMFFDATPALQKIFVANPFPGSIHNRGAAVDLTLFDIKQNQVVQMVSGFDEFSERAFPEYPGGTASQRWYRELLRDAMEAEGFTVYKWEWWHYNYEKAGDYPILNLRFEELN